MAAVTSRGTDTAWNNSTGWLLTRVIRSQCFVRLWRIMASLWRSLAVRTWVSTARGNSEGKGEKIKNEDKDILLGFGRLVCSPRAAGRLIVALDFFFRRQGKQFGVVRRASIVVRMRWAKTIDGEAWNWNEADERFGLLIQRQLSHFPNLVTSWTQLTPKTDRDSLMGPDCNSEPRPVSEAEKRTERWNTSVFGVCFCRVRWVLRHEFVTEKEIWDRGK